MCWPAAFTAIAAIAVGACNDEDEATDQSPDQLVRSVISDSFSDYANHDTDPEQWCDTRVVFIRHTGRETITRLGEGIRGPREERALAEAARRKRCVIWSEDFVDQNYPESAFADLDIERVTISGSSATAQIFYGEGENRAQGRRDLVELAPGDWRLVEYIQSGELERAASGGT
jgi:hypothetical protein